MSYDAIFKRMMIILRQPGDPVGLNSYHEALNKDLGATLLEANQRFNSIFLKRESNLFSLAAIMRN